MNTKYETLNSFLATEKTKTDCEVIPRIFLELLVSAEDHRFYLHNGVDFIAIVRAIYTTIFLGSIQGGSTISMQLVRVITGSYERSLARKLQEMNLAIKLNKLIPKDDIQKIYLSTAYFGWQMNGIHAACKRQNIDINSATIVEAAEIIARLKYPEPKIKNMESCERIKNRGKHIIKRHERFYAKKYNELGQECIANGRI